MKAIELARILLQHVSDKRGGDFAVYLFASELKENRPVTNCYLDEDNKRIIIGSSVYAARNNLT